MAGHNRKFEVILKGKFRKTPSRTKKPKKAAEKSGEETLKEILELNPAYRSILETLLEMQRQAGQLPQMPAPMPSFPSFPTFPDFPQIGDQIGDFPQIGDHQPRQWDTHIDPSFIRRWTSPNTGGLSWITNGGSQDMNVVYNGDPGRISSIGHDSIQGIGVPGDGISGISRASDSIGSGQSAILNGQVQCGSAISSCNGDISANCLSSGHSVNGVMSYTSKKSELFSLTN